MHDNYSIKDVIEEFRKDTKDSLVRIELQTTRTNGRVNSLERSRVQIWTAIMVSVALVGTIVYLYTLTIDAKIDSKVGQALKSYSK